MKTTMTALAALLLASASGVATAQPRERGDRPQAGENRGDRGGRGERGDQGQRGNRGEQGNRGARGDGGRGDWAARRTEAPQPQTAPEAPRAPEVRADRRGENRQGGNRGPGGRWLDNDGDLTLSPADRIDRDDRVEQRAARDFQRDGVQRDGRGDGQRDTRRQGGGEPRVVEPRRADQQRYDRDPGRRDQGEWRGDRNPRDGTYNRGDRNWQGRWTQADRDRWSRFDRDRDGRRGNRPYWRPGQYAFNYVSPRRYQGGYWNAPVGFSVRMWSSGDYLPFGWYDDSYRLDDWWSYGLPWPPAGYDWVRVGADAVLVDRFSGRVVQVVRMLFW